MATPDTIGPSQERVTRTPILPTDLSGNEEWGDFSPAPFALQFGRGPSQPGLTLLQNPSSILSAIRNGLIRIDPNQPPSEISNTIHHEAIHQVLSKQLANQYGTMGFSPSGLNTVREASTSAPGYQQLADAVQKIDPKASLPDEVPAYALSGDPRLTYLSQFKQWHDAALSNLTKLNPKMAAAIQRLGPSQ